MLVTEEEAKEIACPLPRASKAKVHCIGSGCMAWRWSSPPFDKTLRKPAPPARGYCGLAGLATYTGIR